MALQLLCDGCAAVIPNDTPAHGIVLRAYYCEACEPSVAEYERQRDELHTKLSASWTDGHVALRSRWLGKHPSGRLPDK